MHALTVALRARLIERGDLRIPFGKRLLERPPLAVALQERPIERGDLRIPFGQRVPKRIALAVALRERLFDAEILAFRSASALLSPATWLSAAGRTCSVLTSGVNRIATCVQLQALHCLTECEIR